MRSRLLFLLALASPTALRAQSPQACPWLTQGTAATALGADVALSAHADSNWSGSCRFVSGADPSSSIEITVGNAAPHGCGAGAAPLTGIGNTAEFCSSRDSDGREVQTVAGRVRDAWFTVTLATHTDAEPAQPSRELSTTPTIQFLAEQVAGNLY